MTEDSDGPLIRLFPMYTPLREMWSDCCTFAVVVGLFAVGWWFESAAMQWFAFVSCFLILFGRANARVKRMGPQEAADYLLKEYNVRARDIPVHGTSEGGDTR